MPLAISTIEAARGRWREILIALNVPTNVLSGEHQPCPLCGGRDRFRFTDRHKDGDYFCNNCGAGKGIVFLQKLKGWDWRSTVTEVDKVIGNMPQEVNGRTIDRKPDRRRDVAKWHREEYKNSDPMCDIDGAGRYLIARGLSGPWPRALRYAPRLKYTGDEGGMHPAMLAVVSDPHGRAVTMHRTYLTLDGSKANVSAPRKLMSAVPGGGAIRLGDLAETLGIAEGIETALSAAKLFQMPVWSAIDALGLERWRPPETAKRIVIFADNDASFTGQRAAFMLAHRLVDKSQKDYAPRAVEVKIPEVVGEDWNDVLRAS